MIKKENNFFVFWENIVYITVSKNKEVLMFAEIVPGSAAAQAELKIQNNYGEDNLGTRLQMIQCLLLSELIGIMRDARGLKTPISLSGIDYVESQELSTK